jgi:hypothetical protein
MESVRSRAPISMAAIARATWLRGGRSASIDRACPSCADFALHKYSAACAAAEQPTIMVRMPTGHD